MRITWGLHLFTSNVFAMLGLRSLYFLLAGGIERFAYQKVGLSLILVFVGLKLLASDLYHVPTLASLGIIVGILAASMAASLVRRRPDADQRATTTSQGEGPVTYGHGVEPPNGVVRAPGFDDTSPPRGTASRNPLRPEAQRVRRDPIRGLP